MTPATLTAAITVELARRRFHYLAGIATPADIEAVCRHIALRLGVDLDEVRAAARDATAGMEVVG